MKLVLVVLYSPWRVNLLLSRELPITVSEKFSVTVPSLRSSAYDCSTGSVESSVKPLGITCEALPGVMPSTGFMFMSTTRSRVILM